MKNFKEEDFIFSIKEEEEYINEIIECAECGYLDIKFDDYGGDKIAEYILWLALKRKNALSKNGIMN